MKRLNGIFLFFLVLLLFSSVVRAEKLAVLDGVLKPRGMVMDAERLYVTEDATIFIYSLGDFKLLKKFGSQGQGPGEFQIHPAFPVTVDVGTDRLMVFSIRKISYFTKLGEFKKEVRSRGMAMRLQRYGDLFLGWSQAPDNNVLYSTVNVYDAKLEKIREVYRVMDSYQGPGKGYRTLPKVFTFGSHKGKIFVPGSEDNAVDILDREGKKLITLRLDQERKKVDAAFREQMTRYYKTSPETKEIYERMLKPLIFPDYFPVIADFFVDGDILYVMTWKREEGKNEFFTYDMTGRLKKRMLIPIVYEGTMRPYPAMVEGGKLYQLVESGDGEKWEFHAWSLK